MQLDPSVSSLSIGILLTVDTVEVFPWLIEVDSVANVDEGVLCVGLTSSEIKSTSEPIVETEVDCVVEMVVMSVVDNLVVAESTTVEVVEGGEGRIELLCQPVRRQAAFPLTAALPVRVCFGGNQRPRGDRVFMRGLGEHHLLLGKQKVLADGLLAATGVVLAERRPARGSAGLRSKPTVEKVRDGMRRNAHVYASSLILAI